MDPRELRAATRAEHEATEALMPLMGPGLTRETYVATLQTLLPIVESWETWAARYVPNHLRTLLAPRRRAHLLVADLRTFGEEAGVEPEAGVDWAAVVNVAGAGREDGPDDALAARFLGAMYVMEGSTLGGRFLARHVEAELGLQPGQGDAYFQGHGEATGAMWREITDALGKVPQRYAPLVIEAAKRAFVAFGDALRAGKFAQEPVRH